MNTIRDLIDTLEGFAAATGDETPVRVATMGVKKPMEYAIGDIDVVEVGIEGAEVWDTRSVLYVLAADRGQQLAHEARVNFAG
jgi:hypothetical protein